MKLSFLFAAAVAVAAAGTASAATNLDVKTGGIYNPGALTATGTPAGNYLASAIRLTGKAQPGNSDFDIWAFCVDLAHTINLGIGSQANVNYSYALGTLTEDGYGNALTASQVQQMMGLASLGFSIAKGNDPDRSMKLAAIQGAIWQVEYGNATFASNNSFAGLDAQIASYLALAPSLTGKARFAYSLDRPQKQAFLTSYVPEPATWAMLIAGFGMVGSVARRRRQTGAVTA